MTRQLLLLMLAAALLRTPVTAQDAPAFDVASVKRNTSGTTETSAQLLPNGVNLINLPLRPIIQLAYGVTQASRMAGVPDWSQTARFDIVARTETAVPGERVRAMLQALLAERFQLAVHSETRRLPAYTLLLARSDGRLGAKLRPSSAECAAQRSAGGAAATQSNDSGVICGPRPGGPGGLILVGSPISQLAGLLSLVLGGQTVIDQTGLTGRYDIDLSYEPERSLPGASEVDVRDRPSLFTALQEQLGLELEPRKEPIEVLVIDRVELPTEN